MSVLVRIPTPLRRLTNGQDRVSADGDTLNAVIGDLEGQFAGIKDRLCGRAGRAA